MPNLSSALDNLYSNLVLRDILSFIIPGSIVFFSILELSPKLLDSLDIFSILKTSEVLLIVIMLGVFYIVGILVQIIREIFQKLWPFQFPARWINIKFNPEQKIRNDHKKLKKIYETTGQFQEKSSQLLERFTVFFQCCGNSCIAFGIAWFVYSSDSMSSFFLISLCIFSYIGYVIHKERREIWMSVILNENDRLKQLFFELRDEREIIDKKIDLVETTKTPNFQGLNILGLFKLLRYNPLFFKECLSRHDDNIIRFVLLHEAGHIETGSWYRIENIIVGIILMVIVVAALTMILFSGFLRLIVLIISMVVIVGILCIIIRSFLESMKNDEFVADEHAFKKMQANYPIGHPCVFIDDIFNAMDSLEKDPSYKAISTKIMAGDRIKELLIKYSGLEKGYHPTNEDRAIRLKEIATCK